MSTSGVSSVLFTHSFLILKSTTQTTLKRIHREISDLKKEDLGDISVGPVSNDNPFLWRARIPGPEGSVYEGGIFNVEIVLSQDYPCVFLSLYVHRKPKIIVVDFPPPKSYFKPGSVPSVVYATCSLTKSIPGYTT